MNLTVFVIFHRHVSIASLLALIYEVLVVRHKVFSELLLFIEGLLCDHFQSKQLKGVVHYSKTCFNGRK